LLATGLLAASGLAGVTPACADWIGTLAGDYSSISGYTYLSIVNTGKKDETGSVAKVVEK
jgi:hypothetical protein